MKISIIKVGYLEANCYILEKDKKVIVIDPGDEYDKIAPFIKNKEIVKVLITHYHPDHIGALSHFEDKLILKNPKETTYNIGPFSFIVIYTKGHTSDSITYYFKEEEVMFTGDFLFKETIGRTDLPGGNQNEMLKSLNKIKSYPGVIKIYPGHGPSTTLKHEKENNYFLKQTFL